MLFPPLNGFPVDEVGFGDAELGVAAVEFALDFRIGGHRGEVGFPSVAAAGYDEPWAIPETFQQAELGDGTSWVASWQSLRARRFHARVRAFSLMKRLRERKAAGLSKIRTARRAASCEANHGRCSLRSSVPTQAGMGKP